MFLNNFSTTLIEPLTNAEGAELPVDMDSLSLAKAVGMMLTISNEARTEFEIVQYFEGELLRGLEGTPIQWWDAGSIVYCSLTAASAERIYTPAVSYEAVRLPLQGKSVADPFNVDAPFSLDFGIQYKEIVTIPTEQDTVSGTLTTIYFSVDSGATFPINFSALMGEKFVAFFMGQYSTPVMFVVTAKDDGSGLFFYAYNLLSKRYTRSAFNVGAGESIKTTDLIQGRCLFYVDKIYLYDGSFCYEFTANESYDNTVQFTGDVVYAGSIAHGKPSLAKGSAFGSLRSLSSYDYFTTTEGESFYVNARLDRFEIMDPWFVPSGFLATHILDTGSQQFAVTQKGLLVNQHNRQLDLELTGDVIGLYYESASYALFVATSEDTIFKVAISGTSFGDVEIIDTEDTPYGAMLTPNGFIFSSDDHRAGARGDVLRGGGVRYADGYMPGDVLKSMLQRLEALELQVQETP